MMHYSKDSNYAEGQWVGKRIADTVDKTEYKDLPTAIKVKQELINNFEKKFGYKHEQESFDRNYTFNLGILHILKERFNEENE
jgi:hypothetical protein